jgi:ABC-type multidrug transport system, ATPase and permease components
MHKKNYLTQLFEFLNPYKSKLFIILVLFFLTGIMSFGLPLLFKDLLDKGLSEKNFTLSIWLSILIFLLTIVSYIIELLKERIRIFIKSDLSKKLYATFINKILSCKIESLKTSTETYNNMDTDIQNVLAIMDNDIFFAITQIFSIIGGIIGVFYINWKLACIVFLLLPIKYFISVIISKKREKISVEKIEEKSSFSVWCENLINSIKSIKLLVLNQKIGKEFEETRSKFIQLDNYLDRLSAFNELIDGVIMASLTAVIYILGSILFFLNQISIGGIFSFSTYFINISAPITAIMNIKFIIAGIKPSAERLFSFLDIEDEKEGIININEKEFSMLEFRNLDFSYKSSRDLHVKQIQKMCFKFSRGEKVAILGKNGMGKSTLLNLLLRFYTPESGEILLNNIEISKYNLSQYRKLFAVVDQNLYLFDDSIVGNIEIEKPIYSDSMIQKLSIDSLIKKYENKSIGINGSSLSLGEKQKIAIARAINLNAEIYIFDEPTSSIDSLTINNFWSLIINELNDKTVLCVTHNYSNLQIFDKILIIKDGQGVYFGDYSENMIQMHLL